MNADRRASLRRKNAATEQAPTPEISVGARPDRTPDPEVAQALAELDAINYAYGCGYDIGFAHGYAQREADKTAHDLQQQIAHRVEKIAALPTHELIERIRHDALWGSTS